MNRVEYLDGLRGVAILLVVFFHAYARWGAVVPYADDYEGFFLFHYGWLGVNLFFLISGYVILMTLDKCVGFKEFVFRRWLRLFPAMLFCSMLIYFTAPWFVDRPTGQPLFRSILPGLSFIDPYWWEKIVKIPFPVMEDAFWSLYVEFEFYIFAGIVFYIFGRTFLIGMLFFVFILDRCVYFYLDYFDAIHLISVVARSVLALSFEFYGWFASGAAFYMFAVTEDARWYFSALAMGLISALFLGFDRLDISIMAMCIVVLFALVQRVRIMQNILGSRVLCFFGFISYPLYLMHENFMISSIVGLGKIGFYPIALSPLLPLALLIIVSYCIARYIEPSIRSFIKKLHVPLLFWTR